MSQQNSTTSTEDNHLLQWRVLNAATLAVSDAESTAEIIDIIGNFMAELGFNAILGAINEADNQIRLKKIVINQNAETHYQEAGQKLTEQGNDWIAIKYLPGLEKMLARKETILHTMSGEELSATLSKAGSPLSTKASSEADLTTQIISAPIMVEDRLVYFIRVFANTISAESIPIITEFAGLASVTIERHVLINRTEEQRRVAHTLQEVSRIVSSSLDQETVLNLILEQLAQVIKYDSAAILLDYGKYLKLEAGKGFHNAEEVLEIKSPVENNVLYQELNQYQKPIIINDVQVDSRYTLWEGTSPIRSWIGTPLVWQGEVLGQISIDSFTVNAFEDGDGELAYAFAQHAATAINNSRLFKQAERRLQREGQLNRLSRRLSNKLSLSRLASEIMDAGLRIADADGVALLMLNTTEDDQFTEYTRNIPGQTAQQTINKPSALAKEVLVSLNPALYDLSQPDSNAPAWFDISFAGIAATPIVSGDTPLGVLAVFNQKNYFVDSVEILRSLEAVGRQSGVAIENALLFKQVNEYADNLAEQVEARTAEIRTEKEQTEAILASAADAIIITSVDSTIEYVNPAFSNLTGYFPDEVLGRTPRLLKSNLTPPQTYRLMWHTILGGKVWRGNLKNRRSDGSLYDSDLTISPIYDRYGKIARFVGIQRDISKLKEIDRLKTEFLGTAAHELRSPLTTIRGYAELLLARGNFKPEQIKAFITEIHDSAVSLTNLVSDLLDVSKIESGSAFGIDPEVLNPQKIFHRVVKRWQERTDDHTIILHEPAEYPELQFDPARLEQTLNNLISNAIKYSPKGGNIVVKVKAGSANLLVSVADQGIGMTMEEQKRVFEKFWRADASSTAVEGTGLGMVIVKHIIEAHGGKIWLSSRKGEGTTVNFTLPVTTGIATILIIEDEASILEVQERLLAMEGYQVITATTGTEGLEKINGEPPDLIILDLMLPGITGDDILRTIKANPATKHIPVVVVSAKAGLSHIEKTFALGAADFLTKPFNIDEYLGRIKIALNK